MKEGEGNVLDHSIILFGSGLRDGNSHSPRNLPLVIAGRAGGRLQTGQHLVCEPNTSFQSIREPAQCLWDTGGSFCRQHGSIARCAEPGVNQPSKNGCDQESQPFESFRLSSEDRVSLRVSLHWLPDSWPLHRRRASCHSGLSATLPGRLHRWPRSIAGPPQRADAHQCCVPTVGY